MPGEVGNVGNVGNGSVSVDGAIVIVDLLTNDIRGTWRRQAASPKNLVWRLNELRGRLREAGAVASVICQAKPMEVVDVTPHNSHVHDYLQAQGGSGHGCQTQVQRNFLGPDGYHIQPRFVSVMNVTYACAVLGWPVPRPTPWDDFAPEFTRRNFEAEWPCLVRGGAWSQGGGLRAPRANSWMMQ